MIKLNQLYQGDCLEVMRDIDDNSIDMILCDLPYGRTQCKWDIPINLYELWIQYKRIIKERAAIVLFGIQPFTSQLICSNLKMYRHSWVWKKSQAVGHLNAWKQPMRNTEDICVFYKKQCLYKPILKDKKFESVRPVTRRTKKTACYGDHKLDIHKCPPDKTMPATILEFNNVQGGIISSQKPLKLCEYLIKTYTDGGMLVLDNCIGSGTTSIASMNLNRNWIGVEKDGEIYELAKNRIEEYKNKLIKGFDSWLE